MLRARSRTKTLATPSTAPGCVAVGHERHEAPVGGDRGVVGDAVEAGAGRPVGAADEDRGVGPQVADEHVGEGAVVVGEVARLRGEGHPAAVGRDRRVEATAPSGRRRPPADERRRPGARVAQEDVRRLGQLGPGEVVRVGGEGDVAAVGRDRRLRRGRRRRARPPSPGRRGRGRPSPRRRGSRARRGRPPRAPRRPRDAVALGSLPPCSPLSAIDDTTGRSVGQDARVGRPCRHRVRHRP